MKKLVSILLALTTIMLTGFMVACNEANQNKENNDKEPVNTTLPSDDNNDKEPVNTTVPTDDNNDKEPAVNTTVPTDDNNKEPADNKVSLDGKRVIFIGNSHTYYGKTVINKSNTAISDRENDKGMFYHLCRLNGMNVSVTNWTFGSHNLSDTFSSGACPKCDGNVNHQNALTNRYYDYVIIQEGSAAGTPESFLAIFEQVYNFFKQANPNVKFVLTLSTRAVEGSYQWLPAVEGLKESHGLIVSDLGNMVWDIVNGKTKVPGATLTYNKNSFIICKTASDGYHPNLLTGYLTSLFTYCAITGESAVGQPYSFAIDTNTNAAFNHTSFISQYYTYKNPSTNFALALQSDADMKGFQQLVDKYLEEQNGKAN